MLNKFIKNSVASKFFLMNLVILVCIIGSQLIFQVLYFDKYYLNRKENNLQQAIEEFKEFFNEDRTDQEIISFIDKVQRQEKVALCYRDEDLTGGYSLEMYMGQRQIIIKNKDNKKSYKVILGEQFPKVKINKGDYIEVGGNMDKYGYLSTYEIQVNGDTIEPYYNIIPSYNITADEQSAIPVIPSIPIGNPIYVQGKVEELIPADNSYALIGNADLYLEVEEKNQIVSNNKYTTKTNAINSVEEILLVSEKFSNGYLIAMTPLSEVNDVIENMNSYYLMIFLVAFLLVIIVSLVYSKYMTKPLVEMSNIAKRISECDFQYKYNVKSDDEIGVLGTSLNLISSNLEKSLSDLQDTNAKLKSEMDIKNIQEERRKELIANISHELKTPITIIQGSINGVKSGIYTEDMYENILEETTKMNELVQEMLEISKLESPTFVLNKEVFDLGSIFLKEKDKLKSMIKEKNITVTYNDFDEIIVFGDEKRINQVVTNFLTNAIKYTPDNGKIDVKIILNNYNQYTFVMENFGTTLDKGEIDRIWDPFYRKEKSRNKKFGGTGLGLYIVKRILEVHKSNFGVISNDNSVIFYFTLSKGMAY